MLFLKLFVRRNFIKNKLTYLNIVGLILGMFTFLFIYYYVYVESHYDEYLADSEEIYHLELNIKKNGQNMLYSSTPIPMAETLYKEVPGIENWSTYCSIFETSVLDNGKSEFLNPQVIYANKGFLSTFHYKPLSGNLKTALEAPGNTVITRSAAIKYFGTDQVINKDIRLLHNKKKPLVLTVKAVIEDIPYNSNIKFDLVCNLDDYLNMIGDWVAQWFIKPSQSYITIKKDADLEGIKHQITSVVDKYMNSSGDPGRGISFPKIERISEKHFKKNYTLQHPTERFVSKTSLKILFFVGLITLIISWLNYTNFLIFQNTKFFNEIGIKKVLGSTKRKLSLSLLQESLILISIPVLLTLILFFTISPLFYKIFDQNMDNIQINSFQFWIPTISVFLLGTLFSTLIPIIKLVSYQPIEMIQNKMKISSYSGRNNYIFLIFQFVLSALLIIGIMGINSQLTFLDEQPLGFNQENVLVMPAPISENEIAYEQKMGLFKDIVEKNHAIAALSATSTIPGKRMITEHFGLKNKEETINKYLSLSADYDYFNVIDVNFLAGRNFSRIPELVKEEIIINETLMNKLGFSNPEDVINLETNKTNTKIVGVIKDYHHTSFHDDIQPMLFQYGLDRLAYLIVRFKGQINYEQIAFLKDKWDNIFTNSPFEYSFLKDEFKLQYKEEKQLSKIVMFFSFLSVIITILGIIGTCFNHTYTRTKEIGVRKVNGAKVSEMILLLNKGYIKALVLAFMIAAPTAWYFINLWLQTFVHRTNISWWIFVIAYIILFIVIFISVAWPTWKASKMNPVKALRYE